MHAKTNLYAFRPEVAILSLNKCQYFWEPQNSWNYDAKTKM